MRHGLSVSTVLTAAATTATAILFGVAITIAVTGQTKATPAFAQKTGQPCSKCHTAPPALNAYGKKYKSSMGR
jgi:hypothetical protein